MRLDPAFLVEDQMPPQEQYLGGLQCGNLQVICKIGELHEQDYGT